MPVLQRFDSAFFKPYQIWMWQWPLMSDRLPLIVKFIPKWWIMISNWSATKTYPWGFWSQGAILLLLLRHKVDLYHRLHSVRSVIFVFLMYYANDPYVKGSYVRSNVIGVVNKTTLYFIWQTSYYCTNSITYIIQSDFNLLYINSGELLTVRGAPQFNGFTIQCTSAQFCGDQYRVRCCWYTAINNCFFYWCQSNHVADDT